MQEPQLEIYRDGELERPSIPARVGSGVLRIVEHAATSSVQAVGTALGRAVAECTLYHEDKGLYAEYKASRQAARSDYLRQTYMLQ